MSNPLSKELLIGWKPPASGWIKLNVGGFGGLFRDETGKWLLGFCCYMGSCKKDLAKLWSIFHGLSLAWNQGFKAVVVESDSVSVLNWLKNGVSPLHPFFGLVCGLVSDCRKLVQRDWECEVARTSREENRCADWLAIYGVNQKLGLVILEQPPPGLKFILADDCRMEEKAPYVAKRKVEYDKNIQTYNKRMCKKGNTSMPPEPDGDLKRVTLVSTYNCESHSLGSWKDGDGTDTDSLGRWKDGALADKYSGSLAGVSASEIVCESPASATPGPRRSSADMAQEDELEEEEYTCFMKAERRKDFICWERVNKKFVNILDGLELHKGIFSAAEQKEITDCVFDLQERGTYGQLRERTYSTPPKWMRGKGRETIQFGCCYNYAKDNNGNPPGILLHESVDPLPHLFKRIIRRLVNWHVLPPSCVPDSCIVNIYEEGDCIPPHIDSHDFVRPFCTVSFLSECHIIFGSNIKVVSAGEFSGSYAISLPVGSVLVFNGNGADVAKHCVPAVSTKRISITFRKMDQAKRPHSFVPEPDLQGLQPWSYEVDDSNPITAWR